MLIMYFKHDFTHVEIGTMLGVSGARVSQLCKKGIERLGKIDRDVLVDLLRRPLLENAA